MWKAVKKALPVLVKTPLGIFALLVLAMPAVCVVCAEKGNVKDPTTLWIISGGSVFIILSSLGFLLYCIKHSYIDFITPTKLDGDLFSLFVRGIKHDYLLNLNRP